jgi:pimeloyl-ACP methyl ester carboxylesterase
MPVIVWVVAALVAMVPLSYLVERLRSRPNPPDRLSWAPDVPIRYINAGGVRLRYIVAGSGPVVVLLHTLRTQLDMFQKVFPELAKRYRVYALDYPGHGYSDIPPADYTADFFTGSVARFLDELQIKEAVLAGESIGGTIALLLAARHNPRARSGRSQSVRLPQWPRPRPKLPGRRRPAGPGQDPGGWRHLHAPSIPTGAAADFSGRAQSKDFTASSPGTGDVSGGQPAGPPPGVPLVDEPFKGLGGCPAGVRSDRPAGPAPLRRPRLEPTS